jgi:hypothetical protein
VTWWVWVGCAPAERTWTRVEVEVGGEARAAWVSATPAGGPAVLVLHAGRAASGAAAERFGPAFAGTQAVAVFPEAAPLPGMTTAWSGPDHGPDPVRDLHFVDALRAEVERRWSVTTWSVAGASSGAYLTWLVVCRGDGTFDRALIVSRGLPRTLAGGCRLDPELEVRWVGAADDPGLLDRRQLSVDETRAFLESRAGSSLEVVPGSAHAWAALDADGALRDLATDP